MTEPDCLKVYYDAVCPLCRRERRRYERWQRHARSVIWLDANRHQAELRARGIELEEALRSLHVEDGEGRLHRGMDAYILLLRRIPALRPLAWLIGLPLIKPALTRLYDPWVRRRLARQGRL